MKPIKRFDYCKFTIEQEKNIIKDYQDGESMAKLGKKYGCDPSTIKNILNAYNIQSRTLSQARRLNLDYTINEQVFEKIDNPDAAYWLGVMYADGYISENQYTNKFGISVQASDKEWLEQFKDFLQYNGAIGEYKVGSSGYKPGTPYVRLLIGNNKIVDDLKKLGVIPHKSKKLDKIPDIDYKLDFIRGYIDGDGSLLHRLPIIQISGTKELLLDIANYLDMPYHLYQDKSIYSLKYNKAQSEYLEKVLYKDSKYHLDRKYQIAQRSFNSPLTLEDVKENSLNCGELLNS